MKKKTGIYFESYLFIPCPDRYPFDDVFDEIFTEAARAFGENLQKTLDDEGRCRDKFAKALQISPAEFEKIEKGDANISLKTFVQICAYLPMAMSRYRGELVRGNTTMEFISKYDKKKREKKAIDNQDN